MVKGFAAVRTAAEQTGSGVNGNVRRSEAEAPTYQAPSYAAGEVLVHEPTQKELDRQAVAEAEKAEESLSKAEIKAIKKQKRKDFNVNALLVGIMMVLFTLIMNLLGGYINEIAMFIAIPDVVTGVFREGGLAAVENFYYNTYSSEGSVYFALSGITDNIGYCFFVLSYFIPFAIFGLTRGLRGKIFGKGTGFTPKFFFSACAVGMGLIYIWAYAYQIAAVYFDQINLGYIFTLFDTSSNAAMATPLGTLFYLISTCVFAPLGEEFVCRGVILGTLRKYGNWWAIFITATLFGLMHMNFYQGPYALLVGLVLGYVTVKTGSIWCAVLIHMINNTWSCLSEVVDAWLPAFSDACYAIITLVMFGLMLAAVIITIASAVTGKLYLPGTGESRKTKLRAKTLRFAISPVNLIFIAFCLLNSILLILR